jgi:hypothetical protein
MKNSLFAVYQQNSHSVAPELSVGVYSSSSRAVEDDLYHAIFTCTEMHITWAIIR